MARKLFLTEYVDNCVMYGAHIYADSAEAAAEYLIDGERISGETDVHREYGIPLRHKFADLLNTNKNQRPMAFLQFIAYLQSYFPILQAKTDEFNDLGHGSWFEALCLLSTGDDHIIDLMEQAERTLNQFFTAVEETLSERFLTDEEVTALKA